MRNNRKKAFGVDYWIYLVNLNIKSTKNLGYGLEKWGEIHVLKNGYFKLFTLINGRQS